MGFDIWVWERLISNSGQFQRIANVLYWSNFSLLIICLYCTNNPKTSEFRKVMHAYALIWSCLSHWCVYTCFKVYVSTQAWWGVGYRSQDCKPADCSSYPVWFCFHLFFWLGLVKGCGLGEILRGPSCCSICIMADTMYLWDCSCLQIIRRTKFWIQIYENSAAANTATEE